jgi:ParB family chromosome partitioning protein
LIPAFVRRPADEAEALADMIAENEIRADLSPWEKGRIVVEARDQGLFDTLDEAVSRLYPALNRQRRNRIRAVADVVEELGEILAEPETLAQQHLLRLSATLRAGLGDLIQTALAQSSEATPKAQWRTILPIIEEAEDDAREGPPPPPAPAPAQPTAPAATTNPAAPAASPASAPDCTCAASAPPKAGTSASPAQKRRDH